MEINFDELLYQITLRFDASITPAEARALSGTSEREKDVKWLAECLADCAIDNEKIERIQDIDFERFRGVGVIFVADRTFIFFLTNYASKCRLIRLGATFREIG